ncbi:class III lanthionine synthetase LanKC [Streptomyces ipomoeae]|uniref:class III lanthionine synthetase LanKC n=1 Tax=Streptomyces ipomoeae TaxID=103232 RepID=UPI0011462D64|nr:class III lanthionine synthetase LanKC [Streptomyces ipomoeae]MDX2938655.1 class III lanthionine synthetase LanKC [Streptomyces ipomoeae]TQE18433.1 lantipeptide synthetase [Streptomyces ipomoeae]
MEKGYEAFALADPYFYDRLGCGSAAGGSASYGAAGRPLPEGWDTTAFGDWLAFHPPATLRRRGPLQGWKIHVSATLHNAEKVASAVWEYCVARAIAFKFIPTPRLWRLRNSKYAARDASGKFATLYPVDERQLRAVLTELGSLLEGEPGPYILTDLRWGNGPLYVRYGAFAPRYCVNEHGVRVPAVENREGTLVPDRREPSFQVPAWVELPAFLRPALAARNAVTTAELPYRIDQALHYSNGGGVYAATDTRNGDKVVLKEARPHAGIAADGADAVARLERERNALRRLNGLGVAPGFRDWLVVGDHRFLVMDFLPGTSLNKCLSRRYPLYGPAPDPADVADYTAWAMDIHQRVERAVQMVHSRGLVFHDLHLFNVMVADDATVRLLDFEAAGDVAAPRRQSMASPAFVAPPDRQGIAVDRYALACLRLALFMPMTSLLTIDRNKAAGLVEAITEVFPVPEEFLAEAVAEITRPAAQASAAALVPAQPVQRNPVKTVSPADWPRSRHSMIQALLASATPRRGDRLYPGDVAQFADGGGLNLAYGAAGVLYVLNEIGAPRHEEGEQWLLEHTKAPKPATPLGLYDGLSGVAYLLDRLGHRHRALDLVDRLLHSPWEQLGTDLHGGLPGIVLTLTHFARNTGDSTLGNIALKAADIITDRLTHHGPTPHRRAGLMRGAAGAALAFLRLHEHTGDTHLLDLSRRALTLDLDRCVSTDHGLHVDERRRTMPYLGDGSAGIGMVIDDYLVHREDDDLLQTRTAILTAARGTYYAQPGLWQGRAGLLHHLARTPGNDHLQADITTHVHRMHWYAMSYQGHLAFPGHQMMRLSMDLATGTAGILLALDSALGTRHSALPFLPPPATRNSTPGNATGTQITDHPPCSPATTRR